MKRLLLILMFPVWACAQPVSTLPAASTLGGTEVVLGVQAGASKKISINQISTFVFTGKTTLAHYNIIDAQALDADLTAIGALSATNDDMIQRKGGVWTNRNLAQIRTDLALVTQNITNGTTTSASSEDALFDALALKATLASPTFTGVPAGPTAAPGTNTTQLATTAFVIANVLGGAYVIDLATPSTTGGTITFDMNSQNQRMFVGSASFSTPKIFAMSNTTNAKGFVLSVEVTNVAAVITLPGDWFMSSSDSDGSVWTPPTTGIFEFGGRWYGTFWSVSVQGPLH